MESSAGGGLCESLGGAQGVGGCYKEMKPGGVELAGPDCRGRVIGLPPGLMLCSGAPSQMFSRCHGGRGRGNGRGAGEMKPQKAFGSV